MEQNTRAGILLMIGATFVFAMQDGISRHLADAYSVWMVVMIRYWFFAAFVIWLTRRNGELRSALRPARPYLQVFRGILLALEICVTVLSFVLLGLVESHAIFACYPLLVAAFSGPVLGETVGWRRWLAIGVGFIGILVILQPGVGVFAPEAIVPLIGALMFALYGLLTRLAAKTDSTQTSFFWTGIVGAVVMTVIGASFWEPMIAHDWGWMALLCVTGVLGHWLLIKCYEFAEASVVQPFAYLQLVFVSILGVSLFGEELRTNVVIGAAIVVGAGIFTLIRSRRATRPIA
ncbi:DMT family transporter [Aliiroseovarius sp. S2029]|uniref:DMT family transporter n=1 Tax=Aliiroseovarius sp. S2029 TaxID=2936988 RepID=UPI0020BF2AB3|nr:DMT family transporter [Aliiroseovarius sp. S2029]MCK8485169.1 DMT family transporter [Aliiroseovarius sp. S2029]